MIKCERCPLEDECKVAKSERGDWKVAAAFAFQTAESPDDNFQCPLYRMLMNGPMVPAVGKELDG